MGNRATNISTIPLHADMLYNPPRNELVEKSIGAGQYQYLEYYSTDKNKYRIWVVVDGSLKYSNTVVGHNEPRGGYSTPKYNTEHALFQTRLNDHRYDRTYHTDKISRTLSSHTSDDVVTYSYYYHTYLGQYVEYNHDTEQERIISKAEYDKANSVVQSIQANNNKAELEKQQETETQKANSIYTAWSSGVANKTRDFQDKVNALNLKFNTGRAVYTQYVKFKANNQVLVDTTSDNWTENCLISFKNEMSGAGQANQFTLEIIYKPNDRNITNIMAIENILLSVTSITTDPEKEELKGAYELFYNCTFQYGYGDDSSLRSPWYNGRILDYDCKIDNGNLRYTITGTSGLIGAREIRLSTNDKYLTGDNGAVESNPKPLQFLKRIIDIEFGKDAQADFKDLYRIEFDESCMINGELDGEALSDDFIHVEQKNLFQAIQDILSATVSREQYDLLKQNKLFNANQKDTYDYYLDDTVVEDNPKTIGTIIIYKRPGVKSIKDIDVSLTFNFFGPQGSGCNYLIKDWHPKFEGSTLLSLAGALNSKGDVRCTMDASGNIISVPSMGAAREGILTSSGGAMTLDMLNSTMQEYSKWSVMTQYPYKADMTTLGIPCEVPILTVLNINAVLGAMQDDNVNLHHSSGKYYVTKKTDILNSSGFISNFELLKLTETYNPEVKIVDIDDSREFKYEPLSAAQLAEQSSINPDIASGLIYNTYTNTYENAKILQPVVTIENDGVRLGDITADEMAAYNAAFDKALIDKNISYNPSMIQDKNGNKYNDRALRMVMAYENDKWVLYDIADFDYDLIPSNLKAYHNAVTQYTPAKQ